MLSDAIVIVDAVAEDALVASNCKLLGLRIVGAKCLFSPQMPSALDASPRRPLGTHRRR